MRGEESDPLIPNQEIGSHDVYRERNHKAVEGGCGTEGFIEEGKRQLSLALPLIAVNMLQYCLQVISVMFVGHLGELALSSASMATSFASVTGFSVLEWEVHKTVWTEQAVPHARCLHATINSFLLISIALAVIWYHTSFLLVTLGQDQDISAGAGEFNRWMIPGLFAYGILQCLIRFLQAQNNVVPMMISSGMTAIIHIFMCWLFLFNMKLGSRGAALANAVSYWINVFCVYIKFSTSCAESFTGFSREAFDILSSSLQFLQL
ncbi:UNVERIFIED_CONTAM: protein DETOXIFICATION 17 [Sesamum angustifolium]|uniref:Protein DETOXIFICATION 17 n=1 Tax=Sesamum angustifolium TaxID=2727405 RepID=A0AAW2M619_9LAMI